jgi:hypothetical protein
VLSHPLSFVCYHITSTLCAITLAHHLNLVCYHAITSPQLCVLSYHLNFVCYHAVLPLCSNIPHHVRLCFCKKLFSL